VLQQYQCLYGTAIVMEVETGKIRALVNLGRDSATGNYIENQNYALTRAEPGSTFKLVTLLSLLNDGLIKVDDIVDCEGGAIRFGNRTMRDSHLGAGLMTIRDAFAHSSNAAMAKLAFQHYYKEPERFIKHLERFGVDQKTGIDIAGEQRPAVVKPGDKEWSGTSLPWMATGYGIVISPLRTCMLYNGLANEGRMMKPYLVSAVRQYGKDVKRFEPTMVLQMGDTGTIHQMQSCAREVVLSGTGKHIKSPHYGIAGKTGTAQVADMIGGKWYPYSAGVYQGSFVGYFPTEKPKYTICVVIRTKPHSGAYYGGTLAAPVFRMISDKIFASGMGAWSGPLDSIAQASNKAVVGKLATAASYRKLMTALGLTAAPAPVGKSSMVQIGMDTSKALSLHAKPAIRGTVPDVSGMGLRDAVYLLETSGLQVLVRGRGTVQAQSISPGSQAIKGQAITIQLG
jgi:cell division protein FtsI (penicillin-binding protein 3)